MEEQQNGISKKVLIGVLFLILVLTGFCIYAIYSLFGPSRKVITSDAYFATDQEGIPIIYNSGIASQQALKAADTYYLPLTVLQTADDFYYLDEKRHVVLYALPMELREISVVSVGSVSEVTGGMEAFHYAGETYIEISVIDALSYLEYGILEGPERIWVWDQFDTAIQTVTVTDATKMRQKASKRSDIVQKLSKGEVLMVLEDSGSWKYVISSQGISGYVSKADLGEETTQVVISKKTPAEYTSISLQEPVCLVWHQVFASGSGSQTERMLNALEQTKGVNVISPTWFSLTEANGAINSLGDPAYVAEAHARNIQVWGLVDNFDDSVDNLVLLSTYEYRQNFIHNLMSEAERLNLDGINVDFEANSTGMGGLNKACGVHFVQFIRELSVECRKAGLVLSVDNYVPRDYNQYYHRAAQAEVADYIIVMGYDEHYGGSDPGSTASIAFVQDGIEKTLLEVPKEKLINAVPFYTRLWKMTPEALAGEGAKIISDVTSPVGPYALSSSAVGAGTIPELLQDKEVQRIWLEEEQQSYAEYLSEECYYRIWIEDAQSMEKRMELMSSYDLAGVACWKLGLEASDMWDAISQYIGQ